MSRHLLTASALGLLGSMSASERAAGRFMRGPEPHAPAAPEISAAALAAQTLNKAMTAVGGLAANPALGVVGGNTPESILRLYSALTSLPEVQLEAGLEKATYNQSGSPTTGLTAFDLEGPAKLFYPVLTPIRNMLPRVSGKGGIQASWRAITGVNTGKLSAGVSEGNRNAVISVTTAEYVAAYRGIGFESSATFEAQYAGQGYDDVRRRAAQAGLHSLMIAEEAILLHGNGTLALGTTPTPSLTAATTGGTLATATYSVICVALTAYAYNRVSVAGGLAQTYARTNADASTDTINGGTAQKSTAATVAVTGATGRVTATVSPVRGAQAYAWYWGAAGSETLGAITTVPALSITATATGTQLASALTAADYSINGLEFDGLITQALKSGSGAYWKDLGGAPLTANGNSGVVEIDDLLQYQWDTWRVNPDTIWVSSRDSKSISDKMMSGKANGSFRIVADASSGMTAGAVIATGYLNQFGLNGATQVAIRQHPNIIPGTMLVTQSSSPYPMADVDNMMQVRCRQDYYQIEWPLRSRKYEYGVYADEVLQHYAPFTMAILTGIGAG